MKLWAFKHSSVKGWQRKHWAMRGGVLIMLLLAGCATPEVRTVTRTVEVKVPVATRATPPGELMAPYRPDPMPVFVAPSDSAATAALTAQGVDALWLLIADLVARDTAWRAWAAD